MTIHSKYNILGEQERKEKNAYFLKYIFLSNVLYNLKKTPETLLMASILKK